jgi:hypothetical protein
MPNDLAVSPPQQLVVVHQQDEPDDAGSTQRAEVLVEVSAIYAAGVAHGRTVLARQDRHPEPARQRIGEVGCRDPVDPGWRIVEPGAHSN